MFGANTFGGPYFGQSTVVIVVAVLTTQHAWDAACIISVAGDPWRVTVPADPRVIHVPAMPYIITPEDD